MLDRELTASSIPYWIGFWQTKLRLNDWRIEWSWTEDKELQEEASDLICDAQAVAMTSSTPSLKHAHIVFNNAVEFYVGWSLRESEHSLPFVIGHELAHVVLVDTQVETELAMTAKNLLHLAPPDVARDMVHRLNDAREAICDRLVVLMWGVKDD